MVKNGMFDLDEFKALDFKYVEFDYIHETDWTSKASFDGYEYNVIESYADSLKSHVYELAILKVKDKNTLKRILGILQRDPSVEELVTFRPINDGYPRKIAVMLKSRLSNSTRYRARLFNGIEVRDYITYGVEKWGFLFPRDVKLDLLFERLRNNGRILNVSARTVSITDAIGLINFNKVSALLTKAELNTLLKAYRLGFFDEPKKVGLRELSKELNLSISTVNHQLRNGLKKVLDAIFNSYDESY